MLHHCINGGLLLCSNQLEDGGQWTTVRRETRTTRIMRNSKGIYATRNEPQGTTGVDYGSAMNE